MVNEQHNWEVISFLSIPDFARTPYSTVVQSWIAIFCRHSFRVDV